MTSVCTETREAAERLSLSSFYLLSLSCASHFRSLDKDCRTRRCTLQPSQYFTLRIIDRQLCWHLQRADKSEIVVQANFATSEPEGGATWRLGLAIRCTELDLLLGAVVPAPREERITPPCPSSETTWSSRKRWAGGGRNRKWFAWHEEELFG